MQDHHRDDPPEGTQEHPAFDAPAGAGLDEPALDEPSQDEPSQDEPPQDKPPQDEPPKPPERAWPDPRIVLEPIFLEAPQDEPAVDGLAPDEPPAGVEPEEMALERPRAMAGTDVDPPDGEGQAAAEGLVYAEPPAPIRRPPLEPSVSVDEIDRQYARVQRGPVRRFALWASGADRVVLDYARVEETEHIVQGTLVTFTAVVAGIAGMGAASFLLYGRFAVTFASVVIGMLWGVGIFVLDRALVASTYNPYRFGREEVESLTELHPTAPWEHVLAKLRGTSRAQRVRDMLRIISFGTVLRVALALATSYIVAEMALFLVFEPEVNARTAFLQGQEQSQRIAEINARYQKGADADAVRRAALSGNDNPEVVRLTAELTDVTSRLEKARADYNVFLAATAAEINGDPYHGTLSDGTAVDSTGRPGNGAAAQSLATRRDNQKSIVDGLAARDAGTRAALDQARDAIKKANTAGLAELDAKANKDAQDRNAEMARVADEPPLTGLLRRQAALDLLTYDMNPDTLENDPIPACHGIFAPLCKLRNWLLPPTPMGPAVIAFRTIFLVIELLPITFKILQSIRPRRPYDVAKAALEHASMLRSYRMLDAALHDVSLDMVGQSAQARRDYARFGRMPRQRTPEADIEQDDPEQPPRRPAHRIQHRR